jgi:hypothetical protein
MMRYNGTAIAFAATAALLGCAGPQPAATPQQAAATPLGPAEVQALYATPHREDGVVVEGPHAGTHWTKWANPDGTLKLSAAHGLFTDTGSYVVRGNQLCVTWQQIDSGKSTCLHVARIGANEYANVLPNGTETSTFKVSSP